MKSFGKIVGELKTVALNANYDAFQVLMSNFDNNTVKHDLLLDAQKFIDASIGEGFAKYQANFKRDPTEPKAMTAGDIMDAARSAVTGKRNEDHGNIEENFLRVAGLWSNYIGALIEPSDVAAMMVLMKVVRARIGKLNPDDFVDMVGYSALAGQVSQIKLNKLDVVLNGEEES